MLGWTNFDEWPGSKRSGPHSKHDLISHLVSVGIMVNTSRIGVSQFDVRLTTDKVTVLGAEGDKISVSGQKVTQSGVFLLIETRLRKIEMQCS